MDYKLLIDISECDEDIQKLYQKQIQKINCNLNDNSDSGFDLFCTEDNKIACRSNSNMINLKIKCKLLYKNKPCGFYLYPRSSLGSKSTLRLSNSVGIIDSSYRGNIIACVDNIGYTDYEIKSGQRYFQICQPTLSPMKIEIVDRLDQTHRGVSGFGSSGK